jgi:Fe-S-cluster containining protein
VKVFLNDNEINQISKYLQISTDHFISYYTDLIYDIKEEDNHSEEVLRYITLKSKGYDAKQHQQQNRCIFLSSSSEHINKCSIYEVRPTQCRTYPYWPQHMIGRAEWLSESLNCEGMKVVDSEKLNQLIDDGDGNDDVVVDNDDDDDHDDDDHDDINNDTIKTIIDRSHVTDAVNLNNNEIMLNLIIHHLHNRGDSDDNWTYDQAKALLHESC